MEMAQRSLMFAPLRVLGRSLLASALVAQSVLAQKSGPPRLSSPGTAYTVSSTGASGPLGGGLRSNGPSTLQNYIGHVVFANGRGRMNIVEGGVETLFGKGDYLLFDSTDVLIVRPRSHEYLTVPRDIASKSMERLSAMGMHIAVADEKVALDSIGISAGDTIAGIPTRHFRMTVAFNVAMDAGIMQQRLGTESVTDYWVSSSPVIPPNPLLRVNGFAAGPMSGGMFRSLSMKVDSVAARMGTMAALKTKSVTHLITGPGAAIETQQLYEVSDIARRDVDDDLLILPSGYAAVALPGDEATPAAQDSVAARWRSLPLRRPRDR
jgi:hypothetical protein